MRVAANVSPGVLRSIIIDLGGLKEAGSVPIGNRATMISVKTTPAHPDASQPAPTIPRRPSTRRHRHNSNRATLRRRLNPMWIMIVPAIGGLAVGACLIIAGQRADRAAVAVEKSAVHASVAHSLGLVDAPERGSALTV